MTDVSLPKSGERYYADDGTVSVVLDDDYDPSYEPRTEEIEEYAKWLGIDVETEPDLLFIARDGLKAPLPKEWKPCKTDNGEVYYFNFKTGDSIWDHPMDDIYMKKVVDERAKLAKHNTKAAKEKEEEMKLEKGGALAATSKTSLVEAPEHSKKSKRAADILNCAHSDIHVLRRELANRNNNSRKLQTEENSVVIQREFLGNKHGPNYEPTESEIVEYGKWLGLELPRDNHLLSIAREGLKAPLPDSWKACMSEEGELYYFNFRTGASIWDHPLDEHFRNKAKEAKANQKAVDLAVRYNNQLGADTMDLGAGASTHSGPVRAPAQEETMTTEEQRFWEMIDHFASGNAPLNVEDMNLRFLLKFPNDRLLLLKDNGAVKKVTAENLEEFISCPQQKGPCAPCFCL